MALITASEARQQIPGLTGTGEDTLLEMLIDAAGSAIAAYLGYPVPTTGDPTCESASYTLYLDGPGGRDLVLPVWPVLSISSIYDDPDLDFAAATLVASADYNIVGNARGLVRLTSSSTHGRWSQGLETIKASFTAGYGTVPKWLKMACRLAVRHLYDVRQIQGKTSQSGGNVSIGLVDPAALPQECRDLLDPHVLPASVIG